uniref:DDRGK domain-containing protein 1 n=1 Tax=Eptatretus burgeri TaxID=7764 RepID=A0A8C4R5T1_EPTBU
MISPELVLPLLAVSSLVLVFALLLYVLFGRPSVAFQEAAEAEPKPPQQAVVRGPRRARSLRQRHQAQQLLAAHAARDGQYLHMLCNDPYCRHSSSFHVSWVFLTLLAVCNCPAEEDADDNANLEGEAPAESRIGAKKLKKLQEKQQKKAQREAEEAERQEQRRQEQQREQQRVQLEEKQRREEDRQAEDELRLREEQERKEEEEYQRLKEEFCVEDEGADEVLSEQESQNLLQDFIDYIMHMKVVVLEDVASHFGLKTQEAILRIHTLLAEGRLTGIVDDRGKFIAVTPEELDAVADFIRKRGRLSMSELSRAAASLISLQPTSSCLQGHT